MTPPTTQPRPPEAYNPAADEETSRVILECLHEAGLSGEELDRTARAWLITAREIREWRTEQEAHDKLKHEAAVATLAAGAERAILNRGKVLTPAILEATPEQLLQFIDYYESECDRLYSETAALAEKLDDPSESFEYLQVRHKFERLAGFLWEARTQSGVWSVHHPELTQAVPA